jgi:hypothetical protein
MITNYCGLSNGFVFYFTGKAKVLKIFTLFYWADNWSIKDVPPGVH